MQLPDKDKGGVSGEGFLASIPVETPLWVDLYENIRDRVFAPKLPPLELSSSPVPVSDRTAMSTNRWAIGASTAVNGGLLGLLLILSIRAVGPLSPPLKDTPTKFKFKDSVLFAPMRSASGGGTRDPIEASRGRNPKFDLHPAAPLQVPLLDQPQLPVENATAEIQLPDNSTMAQIGVHRAANVTLLSSGPGSFVGVGSGPNGEYGPGGGSRPGFYIPGRDGVSQPVPVYTPEAEFSDEARRQKYQGVCEISITVDSQGNPQSPRVVRALGMGLDEKAADAVMRYRFKPAKKDGKAVAVRITVMVNFRLY